MSIGSTLTTQNLIDYARSAYEKSTSVLGLAGYDDEPALSWANDIIQHIFTKDDPWKWNSYNLPSILTQPYQQDYPTNISVNLMGWLESGTFVDINNPAGTPQYFVTPPIQAVARLLPTYVRGIPEEYCWIYNRNARTATWPGPGVLFQDPLVVNGGGPGNNPICAITDTNGNILTVSQYGTTGTTQPTWPANGAPAGTIVNDGTVQWTVMDPNGICIRVNALASFGSNVWQINPVYQRKPPVITDLNQTFDPIPDDLQFLIKQGFLCYCYKKSDPKMFQQEFQQWLLNVQEAMGASDRETQSFGIYPASPIQGGRGDGQGYGYVGWFGWSSE